MIDYVGKICPYCKTELKSTDDIVVCSECDMPHHKDCWIENQGCTTFGCLGTIQAPGSSNTSAEGNNIINNYVQMPHISSTQATNTFCTKCGRQNNASDLFCSGCGTPLNSVNQQARTQQFVQQNPAYQSQTTNANQNSYSSSYTYSVANNDEDSYIQIKTEYYKPKFAQMRTSNSKASWNWCAFLVSPYWFIYRKMYAWGYGILGIVFVLSLIGNLFSSILSLGLYITVGVLGNHLYMKQIDKYSNESKYLNEPIKSQHMQKKGGVNSTAVVLTILGYAILLGITYAS